jgi:hypothetical protein
MAAHNTTFVAHDIDHCHSDDTTFNALNKELITPRK